MGSLATPVACNEYVNYSTEPLDGESLEWKQRRQNAKKEFANSLYETNLNSSDVGGILRLTKSAHIGEIIESGPYRGLRQDTHATQVAAAIFEKYDHMLDRQASIASPSHGRGYVNPYDSPSDYTLTRAGCATVGVKEYIVAGYDRFSKSHRSYTETENHGNLTFRKSDLTVEESLRLYCSMFDNQESLLSSVDTTFISGQKYSNEPSYARHTTSPKPDESSTVTVSVAVLDAPRELKPEIVTKKPHNQEMTLQRTISKWLNDPEGTSIPSMTLHSKLRQGFEQINDDLYAKKDNKFLVLNGAGISSWTNISPRTKIGGLAEDFWEYTSDS